MRRTVLRFLVMAGIVATLAMPASAQSTEGPPEYEYKLLATKKTSTMQKELNLMAVEGYRFEGVMGGETSFGGNETVSILGRPKNGQHRARYNYKLLATNKTSTMQKEMQEMGNEGYEYRGQTVFETAFGGKEVVVILERDTDMPAERWIYKLLATKKTSTMQKELAEAATEGFQFVGVTVAETSFGGNEVVSIMRRKAP